MPPLLPLSTCTLASTLLSAAYLPVCLPARPPSGAAAGCHRPGGRLLRHWRLRRLLHLLAHGAGGALPGTAMHRHALPRTAMHRHVLPCTVSVAHPLSAHSSCCCGVHTCSARTCGCDTAHALLPVSNLLTAPGYLNAITSCRCSMRACECALSLCVHLFTFDSRACLLAVLPCFYLPALL